MAIILLLLLLTAALAYALHRKHALHWLPAAATHSLANFFVQRPRRPHILLTVVDHFEPGRDDAPPEVAAARLQAWLDRWPEVAAQVLDADGRPAQHTWFYPFDEWRDGEVAALGALCFAGLGEVELHLHHDGDDADSLRAKLLAARQAFGAWGALLSSGESVRPGYGFVHGDWALANSAPGGVGCGVNDELTVLAETGCYADFTLPTPDVCQPRTVNRLYRASSSPHRPRGHEHGERLTVGRRAGGDLTLITGPIGINLRDWHHGFYPAIERAEIAAPSPVTAARVDFWLRCGVGVRGRADWVFVKLHCHGCRERDQEDVLGARRLALHRLLAERGVLHYCTAREMYNLARAAEDGHGGDPAQYRDYEIPPPVNRLLSIETPVQVAALGAERGDIVPIEGGAVHWRLKVGPVAEARGELRRLTWRDGEVGVEGAATIVRR
jgi:hypothetical protein